MSDIVPVGAVLAPATSSAIAKVDQLTDVILTMPQVKFVTEHLLHAGMYTRTVRLGGGVVLTAVLFKIPTVLIIAGEGDVYSNDNLIHVSGYTVLPGSAGRKVAVVTRSVLSASMLFPTTATTVDEAEKQFTDEQDMLVALSLEDRHRILITGE